MVQGWKISVSCWNVVVLVSKADRLCMCLLGCTAYLGGQVVVRTARHTNTPTSHQLWNVSVWGIITNSVEAGEEDDWHGVRKKEKRLFKKGKMLNKPWVRLARVSYSLIWPHPACPVMGQLAQNLKEGSTQASKHRERMLQGLPHCFSFYSPHLPSAVLFFPPPCILIQTQAK